MTAQRGHGHDRARNGVGHDLPRYPSDSSMVWWTYHGIVTESGLSDSTSSSLVARRLKQAGFGADNEDDELCGHPRCRRAQHSPPSPAPQTKPPVARRSGIQLLVGVLIVGAIPIFSTVRILQANALRNERAHADSRCATSSRTVSASLAVSATTPRPAPPTSRARRSSSGPYHRDTATLLSGSPRDTPESPSTSDERGRRRRSPATAPAASVWLTVDGVRVGEGSSSTSRSASASPRA